MKIVIIIAFGFLATGCFKYEPKKETVKLAGSWNIEKATLNFYTVAGEDSIVRETTDLGLIHFNYTDNFMYTNSFAQTIFAAYSDLNDSGIKTILSSSNVWWVSKGMKNLGFGDMDPETGFVSVIGTITCEKKTNNKFVLTYFQRHSNGKLKLCEVWKFKRD